MTTVALRRLLTSVDNGSWGTEPGEADVDVRCVRAADFDFEALRVDLSRAPLRGLDERSWARLRLHAGDIVLEKSGGGEAAPVGRAVLFDSDAPAVTSNFAARVLPRAGVDPRFLVYSLRSLYDRGITLQCIKQTTGIQNLDTEHWLKSEVLAPPSDEQRRIAEFLDDRVARIDRIIAARRDQLTALDADETSSSFETVRGAAVDGGRRESGLRWLGDVPSEWPVLTVQSQFAVELGKMLDEKRQTNECPLPYLRNTNVQWDRVDVDDLKVMDIATDERARYTVMANDLLICEGGQPGRAAIWDGRIQELGFQKALHRARTRGRTRPAWLLECLRVAVKTNAFAAENGVTTIGHLTNEQLRRQRLPFPEPDVQDRLLADLKTRADARARGDSCLTRSIHLLTELKSSLITAAVTGELDVTTSGSGVPG